MSEVTFEEFAPAELASWLERSKSAYIAERMAAGDTLAEATTNADASMERTFPGGSPSPLQVAGWISSEGQRVGELWIGPYADDPQRWWVWNVEIDEAHRGTGLGRKAMLLAENLAKANGANSIGLNVFAQNRVARNLYQSLGYEESSVQMRKALFPTTQM
jgi:ribosomal protein S18 acetylase RimI-like enzyme